MCRPDSQITGDGWRSSRTFDPQRPKIRALPRYVGVLAALGVALALPAAPAGETGFTFQIAALADVQTLDPALAALGGVATSRLQTEIVYATCATLYAFQSSAETVSLPRAEAAVGPPRVSRDGRTYTIVVRRGLRFSDGTRIDARNFARAIERLQSRRVIERTLLLRGIARVRASGRTLTITLRAASGDLPARLTAAPFCPVPIDTPLARVEAVPASGPYVVAQRIPSQEILLARNRYYRGWRPRRPREVAIAIGGTIVANVRAAQAGRVDLVHEDPEPEDMETLGLDPADLRRNPSHGLIYIALNDARPLFRNNPRLRRAVNFAIDRRGFVALLGGFRNEAPTDQILPGAAPGFRDTRVYPLGGDLDRARELARGNVRVGRAVMYAAPQGMALGVPQWVRATLAKIGIDVAIELYSRPVIEARLANPDEPWDISVTARQTRPDDMRYPDPIWYLRAIQGGWQPPNGDNVSRFDAVRVNRRLNAASRLSGRARLRALNQLDADVMRTYAPVVPLYQQPRNMFVGRRLGCVRFVVDLLDYGAVCLRA